MMKRKIDRVMLINTFQVTSDGYDPAVVRAGGQYAEAPLGLGYLAASVATLPGKQVMIWDANMEAIKQIRTTGEAGMEPILQRLRDQVRDFRPDLVGVSCLFHRTYHYAHRICAVAKEAAPETVTVMGGMYPTVSTEHALRDPNVDYVVCSEGERSLLNLIGALEAGRGPGELPGIASRDAAGAVVRAAAIEYVSDLNTLPNPDREQLSLDDYTRHTRHLLTRFADRERMRIASIVTARGCPYRCTFCASQVFWGGRIRYREPRLIVDEIEYLVKEKGVTDISFNDDNFTVNNRLSGQVMDEMIRRKLGVRWSSAGGFNVRSLNAEIVEKMIASGVTAIQLAIESPNRETLRRIKKPIDPEIVPEKIALIRKWPGSYIIALLMVGFPFETPAMIEETYAYARTLDFDWANFSCLQVYPGTEIYDECIAKGYISDRPETWENSNFRYSNIQNASVDAAFVQSSSYRANLEMNFVHSRNLKPSGKLDQAIRDFTWVIELIPDHAVGYYCRGEAWAAKGERDRARADYRAAQEIVDRAESWRQYFIHFGLDARERIARLSGGAEPQR